MINTTIDHRSTNLQEEANSTLREYESKMDLIQLKHLARMVLIEIEYGKDINLISNENVIALIKAADYDQITRR